MAETILKEEHHFKTICGNCGRVVRGRSKNHVVGNLKIHKKTKTCIESGIILRVANGTGTKKEMAEDSYNKAMAREREEEIKEAMKKMGGTTGGGSDYRKGKDGVWRDVVVAENKKLNEIEK